MNTNSLLPLLLLSAACGAADRSEVAAATPTQSAPPFPGVRSSAPAGNVSAPPTTAEVTAKVPEYAALDTYGRALPSGFACDGELSEWGPLAPRRDATPDARSAQGRVLAPPAPHRIALVFEPTRAILAGELGEDLASGAFVSIRFENAREELPLVGLYQIGGGIRPFQCDENETTGEALVGADIQACEAKLARLAQFPESYADRFTRTYRINAGGVKVLDNGSLSPLPGAELAWKGASGKASFELVLPLAALPRCGQSPVTFASIALAPAHGDRAPKAVSAEGFVATPLSTGVTFEPDGAVRNAAFKIRASWGWGSYRPVLSYQPGEANSIETVGYPGAEDFSSLVLKPTPLYSVAYAKGEREVLFVEVGSAFALLRQAGVLAEEPVGLQGAPTAVVARGADLHVISARKSYNQDNFHALAIFEVRALHPDGKQEVVAIRPPPELATTAFSEVSLVHDATWSSFGFEGTTPPRAHDDDPPVKTHQVTVTYKWSPQEKTYVGQARKSRP